MFLIFKPVYSVAYSAINDPDGVPNRKTKQMELYEEQLAAKILKERRERRARKLKKAKKKIEEQLLAGATQEEAIEQIVKEVVNEEPRYPFTPEVKSQVDQILQDKEAEAVAEFEAALQALYQTAARLKKEQETLMENIRIAKKKIRDRKRRVKVLMLLANLDDDSEED